MLAIGSVPYANGAPLVEGLDADREVRFLRARPARLGEMLENREVDCALVPSVHAIRSPRLVLVPEGCISSRGAVASVSLFCRRPLGPGARVLLDDSSLTSAALARILLAGPLSAPGAGFAPCPPDTDPRAADADAVLLIGDPALVQDRRGLRDVDLGEAWTRWTGLPFVWAVWAARDAETARAVAPLLRAARERGQAALPAIARREAGRVGIPEEAMARYLSSNIRYEFGDEERRGLERFSEECAKAELLG